jgi:preprotein translocase subunit SecF
MRQWFNNLQIDWLGKTKYFVLGSALMLLAGAIAMWQDGGPLLGIDFRGGTLVYARFDKAPNIDQIRAGLRTQGLADATIQQIRDINNPNTHEVVIGIEQKGRAEEALDQGRAAILTALRQTFGGGDAAKPDFNSATPSVLAEFLTRRDPLLKGAASAEAYKQLGAALASFRDRQRGGLLTNFDELATVEGSGPQVAAAVKDSFSLAGYAVRSAEIVGPRVGAQLRNQAIWATLSALAGMLIYIAFRFEWIYGAAAVIAVFHDVLVTLGFFAIFNYEISLTVVAALLTLVGYSMNDTIVIFDRMRENLRLMRREPLAVIANTSINQTLSRTFLTSGLTFLTVLVLFLMGGEVLRSFSFALFIGVMVGSYSTVGIAAAMVVAWDNWKGQDGSRVSAGTSARPSERPRKEEPRLAAAARR